MPTSMLCAKNTHPTAAPARLAAEAPQVTLFLIPDPVMATRKDTAGNTALHYAARLGDYTLATQLIRQGVEVNALNLYGRSALHLAVEQGHTRIAHLLRAQGADASLLQLDVV